MLRFLLFFVFAVVALAADCPVLPYELGSSVDGTIASTDCKTQDILSPAATADFQGLRALPIQIFSFEIPEGGGVLNATITGKDFNPIIAIIDSKNQIIGILDPAASSVNLLISLNPAKYTLLAVSRAAGGNFTLNTSIEQRRDCSPASYTFGQTVNGELTSPDCRILDLVTPSTDLRRADAFRVTIDAPIIGGFDMQASVFAPSLMLLDASTSKVIIDGADTNDGTPQAQLFISLPPGEYMLLATASSVSGGTYTLRSLTDPARNCNEDTAAVPASVRGSLGSADCRYADYVPFTSYFSYSHVYKIEIPNKGILTADLISSQFDAYLYILRDNKEVIAEDDDTGGNGNSRLIINLNPGTYTLVATTYDNGETGSFELRTGITDVPNCPIADFSLNTTLNSDIVASDCRLHDMIDELSVHLPAKRFTITMTDPGRLTLDLTASGFQQGFVVMDSAGKFVDMALTQTSSTSLQGIMDLTPGTYTAFVYSNDLKLGTFSFKSTLPQPSSEEPSALRKQSSRR